MISTIWTPIRLFDPEADTRSVKRYATKHITNKGRIGRFFLDMLEEATWPITSLEIGAAWIAERGLHIDDATRVIIRKRVGACLISFDTPVSHSAARLTKIITHSGCCTNACT